MASTVDLRHDAIVQACRSGFKVTSRGHQRVGLSNLTLACLHSASAAGIDVAAPDMAFLADACEVIAELRGAVARNPGCVDYITRARDELSRAESALAALGHGPDLLLIAIGAVDLMDLQHRHVTRA
jgi:hypothetical protein